MTFDPLVNWFPSQMVPPVIWSPYSTGSPQTTQNNRTSTKCRRHFTNISYRASLSWLPSLFLNKSMPVPAKFAICMIVGCGLWSYSMSWKEPSIAIKVVSFLLVVTSTCLKSINTLWIPQSTLLHQMGIKGGGGELQSLTGLTTKRHRGLGMNCNTTRQI